MVLYGLVIEGLQATCGMSMVGRFGSGERWRRWEDTTGDASTKAALVRSEGRSWAQKDVVLLVYGEEDGSVKTGQCAVVTSLIRSGEHKIDGMGVMLGVRKMGNEKNWFTPRDKDISKTWSWISGHLNKVLIKDYSFNSCPIPLATLRYKRLSAQALDCRGLIYGLPQPYCVPQREVSAEPKACASQSLPPKSQGHFWVFADLYSRSVLLKTPLYLTSNQAACRGAWMAPEYGIGCPHAWVWSPSAWNELWVGREEGRPWAGRGDNFPHNHQWNGFPRTPRAWTPRSLRRCICQGRRRDCVVLHC